MTQGVNRLSDKSGALLVSIIVTMTVLAALGAVIAHFTATSTEQELLANLSKRAYYLAESGFRYATSQRSPSLAENPSMFTGTTFDMGSNERFILTTYEKPSDSTRVIIESTGIVNQGIAPNGASRRIVYDISKDNLLGEDITGENLTGTTASSASDTFNNLSGWKPNTDFKIRGFISGTGVHAYYAAAESATTQNDPDNPGERFRETTLVIDNNAEFASQWSSNHHLLSYDVQVKMTWGYRLQYGAQGISFRLHESGGGGKTQHYALSFMRYFKKDSSTSSTKDYIPDSIKPTTSGGGSLAGRTLLVLWEQKVSSGQETRRWIAYKDLGISGPKYQYVRGNQWAYDGKCFTDNSAIVVRVHEKEIGDYRVQDVKIFFADASAKYTSRSPNSTPYDIGYRRNYYWPEYEYPSGSSPYPAYPPLSISDWAASDDYFSFVESSPSSYTYHPTKWDGTAGDITVLSDGGTLRLYDFTTPDGVSAGETSFPADRDEIGLHAIGQVSSGNYAMTFDDFAIEYLNTDGTTTKGFVQR